MLELLNFKPIGKAVLHRAIGLSENYTMDENIRLLTPAVPEQCIGCEQYKERCAYADFPQSAQYNDAVSACRKCQYGKTLEINTVIKPRLLEKEKKKRYVNEKNRYGYAKRLKLRSVLLFIAYHMIVSNSNGILRNVSISDLADLLKCSKRAIRYNNQILSEEGYIYISNGIDGEHINVCLPEYKSYFLPAQEGGRGFFTMSKELFTALCEIKQTTALRIVLKTLLSMETDVLSMNEPRLESYVQIRRYLPDYCKRNIVQSALHKLSSSIFKVDIHEKFVEFRLNRQYDTRNVKKALHNQNESRLNLLIDKLNHAVKVAPADKSSLSDIFDEMVYSDAKTLKPVRLSADDLKSMITLSLEYSFEHVKSAFMHVYVDYILTELPIRSIGALLRTLIRQQLQNNSIPSLSTVN